MITNIYVSPYNCTKVIDTPAQSLDIYSIENLWVNLQKKVGKRSATNKNELIRFIKKELEQIPLFQGTFRSVCKG